MMLILLMLFVLMALAGIYGLGTDSRDPEYSLRLRPYERQPDVRHLPHQLRQHRVIGVATLAGSSGACSRLAAAHDLCVARASGRLEPP